MAMLKFVRRELHSSGSSSCLSEEDIEAAKKGVTKTLNAASDSTESQKRGKYNSYTPEQRAKLANMQQKMAHPVQPSIIPQFGAYTSTNQRQGG